MATMVRNDVTVTHSLGKAIATARLVKAADHLLSKAQAKGHELGDPAIADALDRARRGV